MNKGFGSATQANRSNGLTMRDVVAPLFRQKKIVLITSGAVFLLAVLVATLWASRYYVARMQVVVQQERTDPTISTTQTAAAQSHSVTTDQISSEVALLQGQDMLQTVAQKCGLADEASLSWSDMLITQDPKRQEAMRMEHATKSLAKALDVAPEKTSDVINVKYGRTGSPETPACVLKTLSQLYVEKHLQIRRPAGSADFFAQETDKYQQALHDSEMRLAEFGKESGVGSPELLKNYMAQQLASTTSSLYQEQQAIAADQKRIGNIQEQMKMVPSRSTTSESANSASLLLQNLQATLLAAQNKRTELAMKYDANYPLVREVDQEIADTKAAIAQAQDLKYVNQTTDRDPTYEYLRQDLAKTQADLAAHQAAAVQLGSNVKSMQLQMVNLDQKAVEQASLLREAKANESNYLLYLNKREQERTADALDQKRIANVAIAVPPVVPALPAHSPSSIIFAGFFLAIFAGIAAGFVAEYVDSSFHTPQEVAETLKIPVLASVPRRAA